MSVASIYSTWEVIWEALFLLQSVAGWSFIIMLLLFSHSVVSDFDLMDCSTPGFPVHHHLLEFAQTHVHWVGDAIQPSHPLLSPSPPPLSLSQHQGLFQWVGSLNPVAKVLELQLQHHELSCYNFSFLFKWWIVMNTWQALCVPLNVLNAGGSKRGVMLTLTSRKFTGEQTRMLSQGEWWWPDHSQPPSSWRKDSEPSRLTESLRSYPLAPDRGWCLWAQAPHFMWMV